MGRMRLMSAAQSINVRSETTLRTLRRPIGVVDQRRRASNRTASGTMGRHFNVRQPPGTADQVLLVATCHRFVMDATR